MQILTIPPEGCINKWYFFVCFTHIPSLLPSIMFLLEEPLQLFSQLVRIHHLASQYEENICGSLQHHLVKALWAIIKYLAFKLYHKSIQEAFLMPYLLWTRRQNLKINNKWFLNITFFKDISKYFSCTGVKGKVISYLLYWKKRKNSN